MSTVVADISPKGFDGLSIDLLESDEMPDQKRWRVELDCGVLKVYAINDAQSVSTLVEISRVGTRLLVKDTQK